MAQMPMYGVSSLEQRMSDAADMGGMQQKTVVRLGKLVLHERASGVRRPSFRRSRSPSHRRTTRAA